MTEQNDEDEMTPLMYLGAAIAENGGKVPNISRDPVPFWSQPTRNIDPVTDY